MKKKSLFFTCITLVVAMVMILCGCSTYGKIKSAYEDAGYAESEKIEAYQDQIYEALNAESEEDVEAVCKVHLFSKNLAVALILEFNSTDEMNEKIKESDTLKGMISDAQESKYVSGNCILLFATPLTDAAEIFESTK